LETIGTYTYSLEFFFYMSFAGLRTRTNYNIFIKNIGRLLVGFSKSKKPNQN